MNGDDSASFAREAPLPLEVTIQLLDPTYRRPIKTWKFVDRKSIRIGRGDDVDVEISDAYVSRVHAELLHRDSQWNLISRGRNGVLVGSQAITELPIGGEVVFRLGSAGPSLRFSPAVVVEAASATLCFDVDSNPLLHLDETKLRDEVAQIENDDYFQKLQQKVKELRRQRMTNDEARMTNQ